MYFCVSSLMIFPSVLSSAHMARILIDLDADVSTAPEDAVLSAETASAAEEEDAADVSSAALSADDEEDADAADEAAEAEDAAVLDAVLLPQPASMPAVIAEATRTDKTLLLRFMNISSLPSSVPLPHTAVFITDIVILRVFSSNTQCIFLNIVHFSKYAANKPH